MNVIIGEKTKELIYAMGDIIGLLAKYNKTDWCHAINGARNCLLKSDHYGIESFLSYFGGMGSFNDLVLTKSSDHGKLIFDNEVIKDNNKLNELKTISWGLANDIKREQP